MGRSPIWLYLPQASNEYSMILYKPQKEAEVHENQLVFAIGILKAVSQ